MSRQTVTPDQQLRIACYRRWGWTHEAIGRRVGLLPQTVRSWCRHLHVSCPVEHRGGRREPRPASLAFSLAHYWMPSWS